MECEKCQDRGFTEQEHGLFREFCDCPKGREVRAEITGVADDSIHIGILFQLMGKRTDEYSDNELWGKTKEAFIEKMEFPHIVDMPCGKTQWFANPHSIMTLPVLDVPCYCGNPNHYIVKFSDLREENDGTNGTGQPDSGIGSTNTGQSKRTRQPKAKRKARAKTG